MDLQEIRELSAYALSDSDLADCGTPDTQDSPGAKLLTSVRDAVVEAIERGYTTLDDADYDGTVAGIADQAPSIWTHEKWAQFLDLCAYQEEPETGEWPTDLDNAASVALYQIAERLARQLWKQYEPAEELEECPVCGDMVDSDHGCEPDDDDDEPEGTPTGYVCGYCSLPFVRTADGRLVHGAGTPDVPPVTPGDYVTGHHRPGGAALSVDMVAPDAE